MESSLRFLASTTLLANCTTGVIPLIKLFWNAWKEHSRLFVLSCKSSHNSGFTRGALRKSQFSGRRYFFWIEENCSLAGLLHRSQCYCLSRHVLAVPSFSMHGIIIASIKLSDFWLPSSMNRRLLIKRSDVWSKSEGVIKLTKALSFKRGLRSSQDFYQQSRLHWHALSF